MIIDDKNVKPIPEEDASWLSEILKTVNEARYSAVKRNGRYEIFDPDYEKLVVVPIDLRREKMVIVELTANFYPKEKDHTYNLEEMIDSQLVLERRGWEFGGEGYRRDGVVIRDKDKTVNYVYRIKVRDEMEVREIVEDIISLR